MLPKDFKKLPNFFAVSVADIPKDADGKAPIEGDCVFMGSPEFVAKQLASVMVRNPVIAEMIGYALKIYMDAKEIGNN